ncbi:MAG: TIGR01212 family radical SAM protein [Acutalibacteraceae bacterium]
MYYYSLNNYLKETFGEKVYKLSLNAGTTCPNRDGKLGTRGCIFCSAGGSGEFAADKQLSISEQINQAKAMVKNKIKTDKYIAYFQSYTNTYAPIEYLRRIFFEAINNEEIVALSIATRPDCLQEPVLKLLSELNRIKPVWVELGLQTVNESTAKYIRRGYPLSVYDEAVENLHKIGIEVITHVILGLPNESKEDMLSTVRYVGKVTDGIKLQLLHVLKGTDLYTEYINGKFDVLSMESYIDILCDCIENLPKNVVIHRLTGDGDKRLLVAPMWSGDKKTVLNSINREFSKRNIIQGNKLI